MRLLRYAAAATLALGLAACSGDEQPAPEPRATPSSSRPTGSPTAKLDWQPVEGPVRDSVTRNADWTLTVTGNGRGWSLDGPSTSTGSGSSDWRVSDALLDEEWAVVVLQDPTESRPSRAEVTELATGDTFTVDGSSDVPTTNGGAWALGDGRLLHATVGPDRAYCVASVDLASRESTLSWCAPKRHGFNGAQVAPGGVSVLSFDAGRPSCRTLMALDGTTGTPFEGVEECQAWDGLLTDDGQVWSVIPNERRIEEARFYATAGGERADLGPGTAGSLVWCSGAAYFTRDPQAEGDPAALMRWSAADGLDVAYESPGGQAFLSEPRCGGDQITVTAFAEDGDQQVTARLS
ncbi:hypothetical protein GCM10027062_10470 [Nocardioides hungaricus]